jgi:hypothetical protein
MLTLAELPDAARLPTPPSEVPATPQGTVQNVNHVANALKRRVLEDEAYEKARLRKRQQRQQGNAAASADASQIAALPLPEKITKKQRDAMNKAGQTDDVLHRKANETASMALGKKKKYSWMSGGGPSGASTPVRQAPVVGSGTATPAAPTSTELGLRARKRNYGEKVEEGEVGAHIQVRDLVHVLEQDGREKKTLTMILARMKSTDRDEARAEVDRRVPAAGAR